MKKLLPLLLLAMIVFVGCDKDDDTPAATYMPNTANSTWTYDTRTYAPAATTGSFTLKATNTDTVINGRTYRIFTHTNAQNDYYAQTGTDYYQLGNIGSLGTQRVELLYLKDVAEGTTWSEAQAISLNGFPVTIPINYRIARKGYDTTINGKSYKDVTHVSIALGSTSILGTTITPSTNDIHYFYSRGVGRIYSRVKLVVAATVVGTPININVDDEQLLNSYTIQ